MGKQRLDPTLVSKVAAKAGIQESSVRSGASRRGDKLGVPSEAALLLWAKELGIGSRRAFNQLDPQVQAQLQRAVPVSVLLSATSSKPNSGESRTAQTKNLTDSQAERRAIEAVLKFVLSHPVLHERCGDLLKAPKNFDRAVREATTILENQLRRLTGLTKAKAPNAEALVSQALHPTNATIRVSDDNSEQEGFYSLVKGAFLVYRNSSHHELTDKLSRWDALRVCGYVDYLLTTIDEASQA